jgi:hypothetical protein
VFSFLFGDLNKGFAAKNPEVIDVWCSTQKHFMGSLPINYSGWRSVTNMSSGSYGFYPETKGKTSCVKHGFGGTNDCAIETFSESILLRSVRDGSLMNDSGIFKNFGEIFGFVFPPSISV